MLLCIGDDQGELRREIAQIVHHEGREPVIRLELATLREAAVGLELREMHRDVPSHLLAPTIADEAALLAGLDSDRRGTLARR